MRPWLWVVGSTMVLAALFVVSRLGSAWFTASLAGYVAGVALFVYATRKRPGRRYEQRPPSRADADLQTWDSSP